MKLNIKFLISFLLVIPFVFFVFAVYTLTQSYLEQEKDLLRDKSEEVEMLATAISFALHESNDERVEQILFSFKRDSDLVSASIYDPEGSAKFNARGTNDTFHEENDILPVEALIVYEKDGVKKVLGTLKARFSLKIFNQNFNHKVNRNAILFIMVMSLFAVINYYNVRYLIIRPVDRLIDTMNLISAGDFSIQIETSSKDEIGILANNCERMRKTLVEYIKKLELIGAHITSSTMEVTATSENLLYSIKEIAKTMDNLTLMAEETSNMAQEGKLSLDKMSLISEKLAKNSDNIIAKLDVLNQRTVAISTIITTISEVAYQTNILSLNAAIEAAKIGEEAISFAVIAKEIRNLSDQTSSSTHSIKNMVEAITDSVSNTALLISDFIKGTKEATEEAEKIRLQFENITFQVNRQYQNIDSISGSIDHQTLANENIQKSLSQLSGTAKAILPVSTKS